MFTKLCMIMQNTLSIVTVRMLLLCVPLLLLAARLPAQAAAEMKQARERMVRIQIAGRGIEDERVLKAMRSVPRHRFVPEDARRMGYADQPLPIGHGQTISQPYIVGYMTDIIEPQKDDVVLEIGTGSGYQAAVLSPLVKDVYTVEIIEELAMSAKKRLATLGYDNVHVRHADGYHGWKQHAPYDAIIVTAATEHIPPPLIAQLKDGGVMVIPVGSSFRTQYLMLVEKKDGKTSTRTLMPVRFVPFTRSR